MSSRYELFIGCQGALGDNDSIPNSFAVVYFRKEETDEFAELSRTETVCNTREPQYCTSFEVECDEQSVKTSAIRIDFFNRLTEGSERLEDHGLIGKSTVWMQTILSVDGNHLATQISHPREARKVGVVLINAERIDDNNSEIGTEIQFDVCASVLRKKDWNKSILGQRYELKRAHKHDDSDGHTVWLSIYNSDRIFKQRDSSTVVEWSSATLKYRHACNGDEERQMRLLVYAGPYGAKKGVDEILAGFVDFTLRDLCEMDPTEEELHFEGDTSEDTDFGNVSILQAEPTDYGSHFSIRINHESMVRYTSAIKSSKREDKRRLKGKGSKLSLNLKNKSANSRRGVFTSDQLFSPACRLFVSFHDD